MRPAQLFAIAVLSGSSANAAVVYNNFGPGDTFLASGVSVTTFQNVGVPFVPSANATVTDITIAFQTNSAVVNIAFSICSNASGHPGTALATVYIPTTGGATAQTYHATFASPPTLTAGTMYWVKAAPGPGPSAVSQLWLQNTTGAGGYSETLPTGAWASVNGLTPALRLEDNSANGACCSGSTCLVTAPTACNALHTRFAGAGTACNAAGNNTTPCCKADFNQTGGVTVQDIFDFLAAWFAGDPSADFNGGGLSVQDIFDFLGAWFQGC
jgi:hypothetical protein